MSRLTIPALLALTLVGTNVHAQTSKKSRHTPQKATTKKSSTATTWTNAYTDPTLTVAVDPKSTVRAKDGTYSAHLRWTYTADQSIGRDKIYRTMIETRILDCDSLRTKPIRATTYTATGKVVSSYDTKASEIKDVVWGTRKPGTTSADAIVGVCKTIGKS